jgi:deoxyadenosine/deoxycytidine kinase
MIKFVSVTGAIGSGKTTIIEQLKLRYARKINLPFDIIFYEEPLDQWISGEVNWLDLFYSDQKRWGFTFQTKVIEGQIAMKNKYKKQVRDNLNGKPLIVVTERSTFDSVEIFGERLLKQGKMLKCEHNLLKNHVNNCSWYPDVQIWLATSPEECLRRVKNRGRKEEMQVPDEYYIEIAEQYVQKMSTLDGVYDIGEYGVEVCTDRAERIINSMFQ